MAKVLVLAGGTSDEREVSLRSAASVVAALEARGHEVVQHDPADGFTKTDLNGCEVVFPVLHGKGGEDGTLQTQLDALDVPYVGTGSAASELCFDKRRFKHLLREHELPCPKGELVSQEAFWESDLISKPFVLKPNDGGSSVDTMIMRDALPTPDKNVISELFKRHPQMLLEELVGGIEITVAVLDDQALPVIEIIPPESGEFDYENKYNGQSQELCPPKNVSGTLQQAAQALARQAHTFAGCRDFSRTDIMIDSGNKLYILETNTIPGLTDQSLFPKAAAAAGIAMPELCDRLVRMALARAAARTEPA